MIIKNITQSLYIDYSNGKITIEEVAEELHLSGHTNFIDIEYAKLEMEKEKNL